MKHYPLPETNQKISSLSASAESRSGVTPIEYPHPSYLAATGHSTDSPCKKASAIILADGEYPDSGTAAAILRNAEYVVCCDGAADTFIANGGIPAAIVGDGDSISKLNAERYANILHRVTEQESNDLTKAFNFCISHGKTDITILGATGKREDHTISNISLLADYVMRAEVCMITPYGVFNAISEDAEFESFSGQQVSIFTFNPSTKVRVENLRYTPPAEGLCSWWRGSLNESLGKRFAIHPTDRTIIFRAFE